MQNVLATILAKKLLVLIFSPEVRYSYPILKLACFKLKMTTAVDSDRGVGSSKSVDEK